MIDVGGGDSRLVDALLSRGFRCISVLDISAAALARSKERLGEAAASVRWIDANVAADDWAVAPVDLWHDRAAFHFLVDPAARRKYVRHLHATVKPGGAVILATFALDGPGKCSGLPVMRYSGESLAMELGPDFTLVACEREEHMTPARTLQPFIWARFVHSR